MSTDPRDDIQKMLQFIDDIDLLTNTKSNCSHLMTGRYTIQCKCVQYNEAIDYFKKQIKQLNEHGK